MDHRISLQDLFQRLPFTTQKFLGQAKEEVNKIENNHIFYIFYPVYLNRRKHTQQPLFTFTCEHLEDSYRIQKVYANKNILTLLLAQKNDMELTDARVLYEKQIDEMSAAVDALHPEENILNLYQTVSGEFRHIFGTQLQACQVSGDWQMLEKALVSFASQDAVIENCFRDEMETMERFYSQDGILPETVQQYMGLSGKNAEDISGIYFHGSHLGSYQAEYPVNRKQWELVQMAEKSTLLCVEGPPGTGKTTLLKELIADTLVKKADALLEVWDKPWIDIGAEGKKIKCSPLAGKNPYSIVISSTNNKAIDNIGLELLREVAFFSECADEIETDGAKCAGILCARLGNSGNIEDFYNSYFRPFCDFLENKEITQKEAEAVKEHYIELRTKMDRTSRKMTEFISLREKFEDCSSLKELWEKQQYIEKEFSKTAAKIKEEEKNYSDCLNETAELKRKNNEAEQEKGRLAKQKEESEKQLSVLYSDLEEYESITGVKKMFIFLFPAAGEVKKKYGSAQQIRDMIYDRKKQHESLDGRMNELVMEAARSKERQGIQEKEAAAIQTELLKNKSHSENVRKEQQILEAYLKLLSMLEQELEISAEQCLKAEAFMFFSCPRIIIMRNQLFMASLSLFECYVLRNKEPVLENLNILLTAQERGDGGAFYNWCRALYNGDAAYKEEKAALVRMLWETFFLCFPVVTTTLHSFRKTTFPMIPGLFDLLLIDESGQIVPYYALAPLYRAGRAVFVGDVNQIEPIKSVPSSLLEKKYTDLLGEDCYERFCLDAASAQSYAAKASDFFEMVGDIRQGVILTEHRRCEPAIMAFSNKYVYNHVLELVGTDDNRKLFGSNLTAFDIRGFKAAQHYNVAEIQACQEIVRIFVREYGEEVKKDIGIITPFSKQAEMLRKSIPGVETGTVHVFQGAEKKYILFSCVIDTAENDSGLCNFIGGKCNLLNVAFSRAKKQFIFVGNLSAAQGKNNYLKKAVDVIRESGKIYSLFDTDRLSGENMLWDENVIHILSGEQKLAEENEIGRYLKEVIPHNIIDTPRLHNEILNEMVLRAAQSIQIISPWIGRNVVTDRMLEAIRDKVENEIQVRIIFGYKAEECSLEDIDKLVQQDIPWEKEASADVIRKLRILLGDGLKYEPPTHIKLLMVDDRYLFIGSLNWLYNSGKTAQKEISCLITNSDTIQYVKERFLNQR